MVDEDLKAGRIELAPDVPPPMAPPPVVPHGDGPRRVVFGGSSSSASGSCPPAPPVPALPAPAPPVPLPPSDDAGFDWWSPSGKRFRLTPKVNPSGTGCSWQCKCFVHEGVKNANGSMTSCTRTKAVVASDAETLDHLKFWAATAEMYKNKGKHQKAPWTGRFSVRFGGAAAPAAEGGIASDEGSGCASESSDSSNSF